MTVLAYQSRWMTGLNTRNHRAGLGVFLVIVLAHWAEHVVQAFQIWVLGRPVAESRGVAGQFFPWLVTSEALHYGYAVVMLAGFVLMRPGFSGRSRTWWNLALYIQVWHHFEHLVLFVQAIFGSNLGGRAVPTSIIQLLIPRVELHLFYNAVVFAPMVVAMLLHRRDAPKPRDGAVSCDCAHARA